MSRAITFMLPSSSIFALASTSMSEPSLQNILRSSSIVSPANRESIFRGFAVRSSKGIRFLIFTPKSSSLLKPDIWQTVGLTSTIFSHLSSITIPSGACSINERYFSSFLRSSSSAFLRSVTSFNAKTRKSTSPFSPNIGVGVQSQYVIPHSG